jgi:L-threonylcarbamoyladenylate synthase
LKNRSKKRQDASGPHRLEVDPGHPSAKAIQTAVSALRGGGLVVFPTETFYGLAADPENASAMERLYRVKGRDGGKPVSLVLDGAARIPPNVAQVPAQAEELIKRFWPGPLTLLFEVRKGRWSAAARGSGKIGLRVPNHPVALALARAWGGALTATSANRSGGVSPVSLGDVLHSIGGEVDLLLDAGPTPGGRESTIVDITLNPPRLIREGAVPFSEVMECLGYGLTEPHDW